MNQNKWPPAIYFVIGLYFLGHPLVAGSVALVGGVIQWLMNVFGDE